MATDVFKNPFRPGAGHPPPYLAGREKERADFAKLLLQDRILQNLILTGLRGVGKTVLLETFKPTAIQAGWIWVGNDLSELTSVNEKNVALRLITDLSMVTSPVVLKSRTSLAGFAEKVTDVRLTFETLNQLFDDTPGLVSDKLKGVLETVWASLQKGSHKGIVFAYDEAQNMDDHAEKDQYPLSLLLDVFQSIQKKGVPFMLALTGLPTLLPKLVEARTYSERMFTVTFLDRLAGRHVREAIMKPIESAKCPVKLNTESVELISALTGGYPYFIQFVCREVYDAFFQLLSTGEDASVPVEQIRRKLDSDFFGARWAFATDRQRQLLAVIAGLESAEDEFTIQETVDVSKKQLKKGFSKSQVNQMLATLSDHGLVYKNRHGKYSFAVPMLADFIRRQNVDLKA